jgi:hypothetical protein
MLMAPRIALMGARMIQAKRSLVCVVVAFRIWTLITMGLPTVAMVVLQIGTKQVLELVDAV